jgi:hypothetical protein
VSKRGLQRIAAAVIALAVVVAAGVVAGLRYGAAVVPGTATAEPVASARVGPDGVSLVFAGTRITGPPGVAPLGTVLTASRARTAPDGPAAQLATWGDGVALNLGGLQPAKPLTLTMAAPAAPDPAAPAVIITRRSDTGATQLIPATRAPGAPTMSTQITHLSDFWGGFFRFDGLTDIVTGFLSQTTGVTGTRPSCAGKPATSADGVTIRLSGDYSAKAKPVLWPCLRVEKGSAVITLNANTPLPWRVRAAPHAKLDPQGTVDVGKAVILSGYQTLVAKRPYAEGLLIPGVPMTYRLPIAELPGVVQGVADPGTYLGMSLLFAFDVALSVFGVDTKTVGKDVAALTCLGDAVEAADLTKSAPTAKVADFARAVLSCAGPLVSAAGGELPGPVKVVMTIIGSGVALVAAGIRGAVATVTGTDKFTIGIQTGGGQQPQGQATRVVTVVAVDRSGKAKPGYTVDDSVSDVDTCDASPAATGADVVSCAPSAAGANVCWVGPDRMALLCGTEPWGKRLLQARSTTPIGSVKADPSSEPWGLELADGTKCVIRNGGAWGGRADNYAGAYSCGQSESKVVLVSQTSTGPAVNRSAPVWTVLVGSLGQPDQHFPAPTKQRVVTAYFAGSA